MYCCQVRGVLDFVSSHLRSPVCLSGSPSRTCWGLNASLSFSSDLKFPKRLNCRHVSTSATFLSADCVSVVGVNGSCRCLIITSAAEAFAPDLVILLSQTAFTLALSHQVALFWTGCVCILETRLQKKRPSSCVSECSPRGCCSPSAMASRSSTPANPSQPPLL